MSFEVEQKFKVDDPAKIERALGGMGTELGPPTRQVDQYYAHPVRDFAATDEALRIRRAGHANFITYKGPKLDTTTKTRREIELALPGGDAGFAGGESLLLALGFTLVAQVTKQRRTAKIAHEEHVVELAIDVLPSLGSFVELEIAVESAGEIDAARAVLDSLAQRLQLSGGERRSYLELLLAQQEAEGNAP